MSWLSWPLWVFIGVVAQVISLAALAFVVVEYLKARRRVQSVVWGLDLVGTTSVDGDTYHLADFYNAGTGTAVVQSAVFVGARAVPADGRRFQSVMGSGERVQIQLTSHVIGKAWMLVAWFSHDDSHLIRFRWLPVARPGDMAEEHAASVNRTPRARFWRRHDRGKKARPIGPGHFATTMIRYRKATFLPQFELAVSAMEGPVSSWSHAGGPPPQDLPFVQAPVSNGHAPV